MRDLQKLCLEHSAPVRRFLFEPPDSRRDAWLSAAFVAGLTAVVALAFTGDLVRSGIWTLLLGGGTFVGGIIDLHEAAAARIEPHGGARRPRNGES